jgi:dCMP deaminase
MRESWDWFYMKMAQLVSTRGTCARRQVGVVIVDSARKIVSTGFNGVAPGMAHCRDGKKCKGADAPSGVDLDLCMAIHAEGNAVVQAGNRLHEAHVLYTTASPCFSCMKLVLTTPIKRIVCAEIYSKEAADLWKATGHDDIVVLSSELVSLPEH